MTVWIVILVTGLGCYLMKLAGLAAPRRLLDHPKVRGFAMTVPIALLAALVAIQAVTEDGALVFDLPRVSGLAAAAVALLLRAPFLLVILVAAATAAGLRALGLS
ncbi:AzlD domain-containing protein [Allosalinactinospora lopnorensis]|uniref:AzlD domain-containing protein n=1 Tax=Allosalinactinospora lopnorensis TaxID=1352348 RepID=UPI000623C470|nr:AzlD domain-containing protein [Allosalinactinospora lopnorensis]